MCGDKVDGVGGKFTSRILKGMRCLQGLVERWIPIGLGLLPMPPCRARFRSGWWR